MSKMVNPDVVGTALLAYKSTPLHGEVASYAAMQAALEAVLPLLGEAIAQKIEATTGYYTEFQGEQKRRTDYRDVTFKIRALTAHDEAVAK